jgi:hypothetical protein
MRQLVIAFEVMYDEMNSLVSFSFLKVFSDRVSDNNQQQEPISRRARAGIEFIKIGIMLYGFLLFGGTGLWSPAAVASGRPRCHCVVVLFALHTLAKCQFFPQRLQSWPDALHSPRWRCNPQFRQS